MLAMPKSGSSLRQYDHGFGASASILNEAKLISSVKQYVLAQIRPYLPPYFAVAHRSAKDSSANPIHLRNSNRLEQAKRFLILVSAEAPKEPRQTLELESRVLHPQDEVPVQCELEALVERTDLVPHPPAPEQGFLRHKIAVFDDLWIMWRQDPSADLPALMIDDHPVP